MLRYIKLSVFVALLCMFLCGCSNNNQITITDGQANEDKYLENVEQSIKENEEAVKKSAGEFAKKLEDRMKTIYDNAIERYGVTDAGEGKKKEDTFLVLVGNAYNVYQKFRIAFPFIVVPSIVLGILGFIFSRHNKSLRKFFIITFVIVVPVLCLFILYGIGYFIGSYLE